MEKYRSNLIKDIEEEIKKGKTDLLYCLKGFAGSLSLKVKSEKELRVKMFQNMKMPKNKIEKWAFLAECIV